MGRGNGQLLAALQGHRGSVYSVAFSPDSRRLVTGGADDPARVWNVANGQMLLTLEGHTGSVMYAALSPDGRHIVTSNLDGTTRVYRVIALSDLAELLQAIPLGRAVSPQSVRNAWGLTR